MLNFAMVRKNGFGAGYHPARGFLARRFAAKAFPPLRRRERRENHSLSSILRLAAENWRFVGAGLCQRTNTFPKRCPRPVFCDIVTAANLCSGIIASKNGEVHP